MASSLVLSNLFSSSLPRPPNNLIKPRCPIIIPSLQFQNLTNSKFFGPTHRFPSNSFSFSWKTSSLSCLRSDGNTSSPVSEEALVGEDSAAFELGKQKILSWIYFSVILGVVLYVLDVVWIDNSTGYGKLFIDAISNLSESHEVS